MLFNILQNIVDGGDDWNTVKNCKKRYKDREKVICYSKTPGFASGINEVKTVPKNKLNVALCEDAVEGKYGLT